MSETESDASRRARFGLRRSDLEGAVFPPVSLGSNAVLAALVAQLQVTERLAPAEIATLQERQLARVVAHHRRHTPSFAARLKAAGLDDLSGLERLRALPPIGRRDIQTAGQAFFASEVPKTHLPIREIQTSGSTGEPVRLRKTQIHSLLWSAINIRDYQWNATDFGGRLSVIRPQVEAYQERAGWGPPVESLFVTGASQAIPMITDIGEQLRLLGRFQPSVLVVFPSNLAGYADVWEAEGFDLGSLEHIKTVGETVGPELRERVRSLTGLEIEDHYSSQEAGPIALQCPVSGLYHLMSESLFVEVVDARGEVCREGERGAVLVTDLHNLVAPLFRYACGDVVEVGPPCPCGRTLPTLTRILGRERNLVVLPDGTRHWPIPGYQQFGNVAPIRQFQLVQHTVTDIELRVVCDEPGSPEKDAGLAAIVQAALGYPFQIEVVWSVERLAQSASGKFEEFICKLT